MSSLPGSGLPGSLLPGGPGTVVYSIVGNVQLIIVPAAATKYNRNASILGDVQLAIVPAAVIDYNRHGSFVGGVRLRLVPHSIMASRSPAPGFVTRCDALVWSAQSGQALLYQATSAVEAI